MSEGWSGPTVLTMLCDHDAEHVRPVEMPAVALRGKCEAVDCGLTIARRRSV